MIGPVSSTGRAMMASLQQAIQKGMPPDQAIQYVKSMASQGVAPLADLYAMMNQFQRLKQPQAQAPQTPPTIRDQLNMMDQQRQMQESAMAQGLGGMNAGAMENPRFAGGGIVAFDDGGTVENEFRYLRGLQSQAYARGDLAMVEKIQRSIDAALEGSKARAYEKTYGPIRDVLSERRSWIPSIFGEEGKEAPPATTTPSASAAQTGTGFVPTSPFASFDDAAAAARAGVRQDERPAAAPRADVRAGRAATGGGDVFTNLIGEVEKRKFQEIPDTYSPEERKRIEKDIAGLEGQKKDAARMALARAGFSMAAAASRAGRQRTTGLGALAEGAIGGMEQYSAAQKELRQTERELNKEMASLRRYQDEVARGERKENRSFEESKANSIADLTARREQARLTREEIASRERIAEKQYGAEGGASAYRTRAGDISILQTLVNAAEDNLKNIKTVGGTPDAIASAEAELRGLKVRLQGLLSSSGTATANTGYVPTISGW